LLKSNSESDEEITKGVILGGGDDIISRRGKAERLPLYWNSWKGSVIGKGGGLHFFWSCAHFLRGGKEDISAECGP